LKTVYHHFAKWFNEGLWESINLNLAEFARESEERDPTPSLVSVDSQSQDAEPRIKGRGFDGNKKRNSRKRHIAVDVIGILLACVCTPANESDRHAGEVLTEQLNDSENFPRMKKILGDTIYEGVGKDCPVSVTVENKERVSGQKGFVPEAFRWVVERTFAWLNRQRRISLNFEKNHTTKNQ
jgi:putative transposase